MYNYISIKTINNYKLGDNKMFVLGFMRGAILGFSMGLVSNLIIKVCKKKLSRNNVNNNES